MSRAGDPWYAEPTMWLVAGLPLASVLASLALLYVATGDGATDAVPDDVQRIAQVQQTDLGADHAARALALAGELHHSGNVLEVRVSAAAAGVALPDRLMLLLVHPRVADGDIRLVLVRAGDTWRTTAPIARDHAWRLRLGPADDAWRLVGTWPAGADGAQLRPALAER